MDTLKYSLILFITSKILIYITTDSNQTMNTFSKILLSSVVGLSSIFGMVGEAEARPTRVVKFTTNQGTEVYFSPVGRSGVEWSWLIMSTHKLDLSC